MGSKLEFLQVYLFQLICLLYMETVFARMVFFVDKENFSYVLFVSTIVSFYLVAGLFFLSLFLFKRERIRSLMDFHSSILYVIETGVILSILCFVVFVNPQSKQQVNFVIYYIGVAIIAGTILNSESTLFILRGNDEIVKKIASIAMLLLFSTSLFMVFYFSEYVNNFLLENGFPSYWIEVTNQGVPMIRSNSHYSSEMNFFSSLWLFFTLYLGIASIFNQIKTICINEIDVEGFHLDKPMSQKSNDSIKLVIKHSLLAHLILVSFIFYLLLALTGSEAKF
ncbi:MAG: hypothetical protein D6732_27390 [Methanobacteriota archaeon]|nr:MAG: hypothetical protein D6732_27390 [Euryarchaeota archaeon]